MTDSNKFKANGAAHMAFEATGGRIDYGVNALGRHCGVYGGSNSGFPREIAIAGVGVWGDGLAEGVHGRGAFGSPSIGVRGEGTTSGVQGESAEGAAVQGISTRGRGGAFHSDRAQIQLVPARVDVRGRRLIDFGEFLPSDGETGDLLALTTDGGVGATLWFCARGAARDANGPIPATWNQVSLGASITGKRTI